MTVPAIATRCEPAASRATSAWRPVLTGDEAVAARRAVDDIAAALAPGCAALGRDPVEDAAGALAVATGDTAAGLAQDSSPTAASLAPGCAAPGHDLADGAAGVALLFGYLARLTGDPGHRATAAALLDRAGDQLACTPTSPSLFHGFPGVAWAADHLRALLDEPDLALHDDIDDALLAALDSPACAALGFDVVGGLVGLGVYALERAGRPAAERCAERVIDRLAASAHRVPGGLVWLVPDRPDRIDRIDLGLAHGIPGAIALLARCARRGIAAATARSLLDGAVAWLLTQRRATGFPTRIALHDGAAARPARCGWCYGDAGIAFALVQASKVGDPAWRDIGLEIARAAAVRPPDDTGVHDATLCHGAASLGLLYQRLYHITGDPAMRAAARTWALQILDHRSTSPELAGTAGFYQASIDGPIATPGLMNGAAGAGLVLLAASTDLAPDWDRALMLGS